MREQFRKELDRLDQDLVRMAGLVEDAIENALLALSECDLERAERVKQGDDAIDDMFLDIEQRALSLLAQQQPVAGDLRLIMAIVLNLNDLERSGDLAYNVADLVQKDLPIVRHKAINALIYELGISAKKLLGKSLDAWSAKDVKLAAEIDELDDAVDDLYAQLLKELFQLEGVTLELALNLVLVGRYFERIADHAVNIAERIQYYVTGDLAHLG